MQASQEIPEILKKVKQKYSYEPNIFETPGLTSFSYVGIKSPNDYILISSEGNFCFVNDGEKELGILLQPKKESDTFLTEEKPINSIRDLVYSKKNDCYYFICLNHKVMYKLKITKPGFKIEELNMPILPQNYEGMSLRITEDEKGMIVLQNLGQYAYLDLWSHQWFNLVSSPDRRFHNHRCLSGQQFIGFEKKGTGFIIKYDSKKRKVTMRIKVKVNVSGTILAVEVDRKKENLFVTGESDRPRSIYVYGILERGLTPQKFIIPVDFEGGMNCCYCLSIHEVARSIKVLTLMDVNCSQSQIYVCGLDETTGEAWKFNNMSKKTESKGPIGFKNIGGVVWGSDYGKGLINFSYSISQENVNDETSFTKIGKIGEVPMRIDPVN